MASFVLRDLRGLPRACNHNQSACATTGRSNHTNPFRLQSCTPFTTWDADELRSPPRAVTTRAQCYYSRSQATISPIFCSVLWTKVRQRATSGNHDPITQQYASNIQGRHSEHPIKCGPGHLCSKSSHLAPLPFTTRCSIDRPSQPGVCYCVTCFSQGTTTRD